MGTDDPRRSLMRELLAASSFGELANETTAADTYPDAVVDTLARARRALMRDLLAASSFSEATAAHTRLAPVRRQPGMSWGSQDRDLVRAYVRTGGRTRSTRELDLLTLVVAATELTAAATPDARRVMSLCSKDVSVSIAEIAGVLNMPLSVAEIVVSDLLDSGHLSILKPAASVREVPLSEEVHNETRRTFGA
ncbi:DUF742 domain-containing protein [Nocardia sp. NPDC004604]|uniref:DUF742 domain-containing protein n=1 Tax=Nocardia sp. NPDC004604 TaxID=3157013 RepID=UPI0033B47458